MVVLKFTLTPEAASKIHDLLVCLGKFSETVAIEARRERVGLLELIHSDHFLMHFFSVHVYRSQLVQVSILRYHPRR